MRALTASSLTSLPSSQFRRHTTFYLWYDSFWAALSIGGLFILHSLSFEGLRPEFSWTTALLLPLAVYVLIMAHVFIHNASHGNFPKAINRVVGEICGAVVLTKFASWEIVHRRHHRHSDNAAKDPHPAVRGYWRYALNTLINVELQLRQEYYEAHGDTAETHHYERVRAGLSFASGTLIAVFWYALLGAGGFFLLYLPAFLAASLFVIHFNWAGHNAHRREEPIGPADLDYGWFWLGNRMFFGIYFHGTHHRQSRLFNPMKASQADGRATRGQA